ncbi:hypothetical protein C7M84_001608 [Penaeus vannamei]|uniref:Uncharacterized protein n=1 Tax=Penaeus vannamei TaxID=6689 RepID=A0A3R7ML50_PENVA|nr:hypothetical protein C7M84_001608 [Penaeus vannamei]
MATGSGTRATCWSCPSLTTIRRLSLASILCEFGDLQAIQINPFLLQDNIRNPEVQCSGYPRLDLEAWREAEARSLHPQPLPMPFSQPEYRYPFLVLPSSSSSSSPYSFLTPPLSSSSDLPFSSSYLRFPSSDLRFPSADLPFPSSDLPFPSSDLLSPRPPLSLSAFLRPFFPPVPPSSEILGVSPSSSDASPRLILDFGSLGDASSVLDPSPQLHLNPCLALHLNPCLFILAWRFTSILAWRPQSLPGASPLSLGPEPLIVPEMPVPEIPVPEVPAMSKGDSSAALKSESQSVLESLPGREARQSTKSCLNGSSPQLIPESFLPLMPQHLPQSVSVPDYILRSMAKSSPQPMSEPSLSPLPESLSLCPQCLDPWPQPYVWILGSAHPWLSLCLSLAQPMSVLSLCLDLGSAYVTA